MNAPPSASRLGSHVAPLFEAATDVAELLEKLAGPLVDLAIRLWLARIFLVSGLLKLGSWETTVFLYTVEHPVPGLEPATAAALGTGIEIVCPLLLIVGLATRAAAIPLIVTTLFLQFTYKDLIDHYYWLALLGGLLVRGAGPLSLDHAIAGHLEGSALPFAAGIRAIGRAITTFAAPPFLLVVRVWLAVLLITVAVSGTATWIAGVAVAASVLLAIGLLTRAAAATLAVLVAVALGDVAGLGERLPCLLLLLAFVAYGAGALSLDRALRPLLHRLCPSLGMSEAWLATAPRVVIVGAGFGGIAAARGLRHAWARVTLIDRRNYHLFQPLLYQVATASLSPADIAVPIRALLRGQRNCRVLMERVNGIDVETRTVVAGEHRTPYDILVLATGARHSYFGKNAWEPFAPGLKKIDDATAMRGRILSAFERAETCEDEEERRRLMTFVIVGAGPTGVELAGAIIELARDGLQGEFRAIDPSTARVVLIQSGPRVLPALPDALSAAASRSLQRLGVEVLTDRRVDSVDAMGVSIGNERIESRTVLWAAGVTASPAGRWIAAPTDTAGRIIVEPDLSVRERPDIYALGDTAACIGADGRGLPGLAAVAKQQGLYVAKILRARIDGRKHPGPFRYRDYGSMATIGRKAAVADLPGLKLTGALAWWLWGLVHVAFLVDLRSRVAVTIDWFWSYLTYNRSMRLITGTEAGID